MIPQEQADIEEILCRLGLDAGTAGKYAAGIVASMKRKGWNFQKEPTESGFRTA